jgi:hypothetical protein
VKIAYFQIWLKEFWIGSSESSLSGRAGLVSGVAGILNKKGGDLFDRRLFVEGFSTQRILPP